ncbi:AglZ/HisF2 family acetamidino modification protein [Undibacterium sp. Jales W-56]|uniref:AglZ/HisF2 family acetamidino modification protein n=1 Tax=Undibacterium sp. Jales W-56 TaxID=2897325 RepID=UPI0021CEF60E|nr:AglZ/HisF2 family acetamidino modification protein [Undibacterium sp. Jales W-56]MCU6433906.1 AglZ/HisF2 family acetamidino modification protein [Undibacterium sp. Jales W-56]
MLRPRITPCLLVHKGGLVKTVGFDNPKYVGDPLNAVRIFNDKEVDELMVIDIDASRHNREPDYKLIANLALECRMPLCYGGGVKNVEQFERIIGLGVEKVAIASGAVDNPELISYAAERVGSQSVVVVIDVKKTGLFRKPEVVTLNASHRTGLDPIVFAKRVQEMGAGEIVLNSVDHDGQMKGYDTELIELVRNATTLPLTVLGGAGSLSDLRELILRYGIIGVAAGSLFVFKGKYRAVLINYPTRSEKDALCLLEPLSQ